MKRLAHNFFYQSLFQVVKMIIPIITIPIVSRAIGPEGIGTYNFTNSIIQYFVLFAGLGVTIYGNREIALANNKGKEVLSSTFWQIFIYKATMSMIVLVLYLVFATFSENSLYLYAQSFVLVGTLVDVTWFFMGVEDFKKTSMANLFVQIMTLVLIVLFVKEPSDTFFYILIQSIGLVVSQLIIWLFIRNYIGFVKISLNGIFSHFKGSIQFFIPQVSIMLYTNLNKTLLGMFLGVKAVGYFSNSLQLNTIIVTIITTMDMVLLPYMSGLFAKNNIQKIVDTMHKTIHFQLFFSIPFMFGMLTIFDKLVPWFFGKEFLYISGIIPWFSVLIVIIPLGMAISRQYLMPVGKISEYNRSVIIGAIINISLNLILLPSIGFFGVVIANIFAELFVTTVRVIPFVKQTGFIFEYKKISVYFFSGAIMCFLTRVVTENMSENIGTTLVQVVIGSGIYFLLTILFKVNPILNYIKDKNNV